MLMFFLLVMLVARVRALQVNTTEGIVEGAKAFDGNYVSFYGIPYAGATKRFMAPTSPESHEDIFQAKINNVICAQPGNSGLIGTEDCLTLNIHSGGVNKAKPVFVWLNAEEYQTSDLNLYSYKRLVEEGMVVVTINFRLSIFGFLCLRVEKAAGNAGLKDVIHALKWLSKNIANFGGDPNNIILVGHASGAAIVDLVTLIPEANGLVQKAITLSGSALAPWAVANDPIGYAHLFGSDLAYIDKSNDELATLLAGTPIDLMGSSLGRFKFTNNTPLFAPCIENADVRSAVLTESPIKLIRSGNFSQIPYITGYASMEGTMRAIEAWSDDWLTKMQTNFDDFVPVDLINEPNTTQQIRERYFGQKNVSMETIEDYLQYQGDTLVRVPVIRGARERGAVSKDVWLFEFDFQGSFKSEWPQLKLNGVKHGSIVNYLLDFELQPSDQQARMKLIQRIKFFVDTGFPGEHTSTEAPWNAVDDKNLSYLLMHGREGAPNLNVHYKEEALINPHSQIMDFWNELYNYHYKDPNSFSSASQISCCSILLSLLFCQTFVRFLTGV